MASPANAPCPCHSGKKYKRCCGPLHEGAVAATAEALMRSRYSGYALGKVRYVMETTDPDGPAHQARPDWAAEIERFGRDVCFDGLEILGHEPGEGVAHVTFRAILSASGRDVSFAERSRFTRHQGRWRYHGGERLGLDGG